MRLCDKGKELTGTLYRETRTGFIYKVMRDVRGLEESCAPIARSFCRIV
jgi:hypothetical protein